MVNSWLKRERRKAPRYVLKPEDYKRSRVKQLLNKNAFPTISEIHDISRNGLSFKMARSKAPHIGSIVGLEFTIPHGKQIAWYGRVVRIEEFHPHLGAGEFAFNEMVKVGVSFENLPHQFAESIAQQVEEIVKRESLPSHEWIHFEKLPALLIAKTKNYGQLIAEIMLGALCLAGAYFLVVKLQELGNSQWWIEDARRFFQEAK